jgi:hypothetical protein
MKTGGEVVEAVFILFHDHIGQTIFVQPRMVPKVADYNISNVWIGMEDSTCYLTSEKGRE